MKKSILTALLLGAATIALAEGKPQTTCPVMGGSINTNLYVDAEGYRIYVCCPGCIGKLKADPEKYIEQLKSQGVEPEKAPKSRPENRPEKDVRTAQ